MDVVTLPMYDLPEVRPATLALLEALAEALTRAGWPVTASTADLGDHAGYVAHWLAPTTALSQSCGLPYLEALDGKVAIVGTFRWRDVVDDRGHYRSQIVVRARHPARTVAELRGSRPVVNNPESLSGWGSLGAVLADVATDATFVEPFVTSGAHVHSLAMLRADLADVASIDAVTYRLLERHRPDALAGTRVLAEGPRLSATPLVTRVEAPLALDALRDTVAQVLSRPTLRPALDELGIAGFVPLDRADYLPLRELAARADAVLPRSRR